MATIWTVDDASPGDCNQDMINQYLANYADAGVLEGDDLEPGIFNQDVINTFIAKHTTESEEE